MQLRRKNEANELKETKNGSHGCQSWLQRIDIVIDLKRGIALVLEHLLLGER